MSSIVEQKQPIPNMPRSLGNSNARLETYFNTWFWNREVSSSYPLWLASRGQEYDEKDACRALKLLWGWWISGSGVLCASWTGKTLEMLKSLAWNLRVLTATTMSSLSGRVKHLARAETHCWKVLPKFVWLLASFVWNAHSLELFENTHFNRWPVLAESGRSWFLNKWSLLDCFTTQR